MLELLYYILLIGNGEKIAFWEINNMVIHCIYLTFPMK